MSERVPRCWSYKPVVVIESGQESLTGVVKRGSRNGPGFMAPRPHLLSGKAGAELVLGPPRAGHGHKDPTAVCACHRPAWGPKPLAPRPEPLHAGPPLGRVVTRRACSRSPGAGPVLAPSAASDAPEWRVGGRRWDTHLPECRESAGQSGARKGGSPEPTAEASGGGQARAEAGGPGGLLPVGRRVAQAGVSRLAQSGCVTSPRWPSKPVAVPR